MKTYEIIKKLGSLGQKGVVLLNLMYYGDEMSHLVTLAVMLLCLPEPVTVIGADSSENFKS